MAQQEVCKNLCYKNRTCRQIGGIRTQEPPAIRMYFNGGEIVSEVIPEKTTIQECHRQELIKAKRVRKGNAIFYRRIKGPKDMFTWRY